MKIITQLLLNSFLLLSVFSAFAQGRFSEKITDKWPYLLNEFEEGILYFDGSKKSKAHFNVDVVNQALNYFEEDGKLKSVAKTTKIDSLVLKGCKYVKSEDHFYQVLAEDGTQALLKKVRVDLNALNETGGAYGSGSSTSATTKYNSIDVSNYTGVAYDVVKLEKGKGKPFELIDGYYLGVGDDYQRATKKAFTKAFPDKNVKGIIKSNKVKFNKSVDLVTLFNECTK